MNARLIQKALDDPSLVDPYETEIAKAVLAVNSKSTLTVTFQKNGKTATGKMKAEQLWDKLLDRSYFTGSEFQPMWLGKRILKNLGCLYTGWKGPEHQLRCEDILEISYRKKILYSRQAISD